MKNRLKHCVSLCALLLGFFICAAPANAQQQDAATWMARSVEAPRLNAKAVETKTKNVGRSSGPVRLRSKQPIVKSRSNEQSDAATVETRVETSTVKTETAGRESTTTAGPTTENITLYPCCDCNRILLDGLLLYPNATLQLFNSTPNSVVTVTLGHSGPGRIGFALNVDGPYTDSLTFDVTTNASGNGARSITFYIKGMEVGQSDMTTTVAEGFTNPVPDMEVFACQCPQVPPTP
jgi:hypothetical protein